MSGPLRKLTLKPWLASLGPGAAEHALRAGNWPFAEPDPEERPDRLDPDALPPLLRSGPLADPDSVEYR